MALRNTIVVFTKTPAPGQVKTRLVGDLTPEQAAEVQRACLADTVRMVDALPGCDKRLMIASAFVGDGQPPADLVFGLDWDIGGQRGPDLGARLERAFADTFREGARKVVVVGTDTPWMGPERIALALGWLDSEDVVLGPALDGGYYLIGARRLIPSIFRGIPWSTPQVLPLTRRALDQARASHHLLPPDFDLDRLQDLDRAAEILRADKSRAEELAKWIAKWELTRRSNPRP